MASSYGVTCEEIQNTVYPSFVRFTTPGWIQRNYNKFKLPSTSSIFAFVTDIYHCVLCPGKEEKSRMSGVPLTELLFTDSRLFAITMDLKITPHMFDPSILKHRAETVIYIGETVGPNINMKVDVFAVDNKELLITGDIWGIHVDKKTRQPKLFPDWYVKKEGPLALKATSKMTPLELRVPLTAYNKTYKVGFEDIDMNQHLTVNKLMTICVNTIHWAISKNRLDDVTINDVTYPTNISFTALAECFEDDELQVSVWKETTPPVKIDQSDAVTIACVMQRNQKDAYRLLLVYKRKLSHDSRNKVSSNL